MIAEVKDMAGDRAGEIEFCASYMEQGMEQPTVDVERHLDAFAELAAIGVEWVSLGSGPMAAVGAPRVGPGLRRDLHQGLTSLPPTTEPASEEANIRR